MTTDRPRALRRTWFQVHKWIGIVLTIIFIPLSLTGSLLVWDQPLDRLLRPAHHRAAPAPALPADAYVRAARAVLPPGKAVLSLALPPGEPVMVTAGDLRPAPGRRGPPLRTGVWLDPATARVIDSGPSAGPFVRWMHVFHGSLQIPGIGRSIVGWLGVLMVVSAVSGLWLWWPATGRWIRGLRWRRRREFDTNLHHLVGFWVALPLGLLAFTGVLISFPALTGGGGRPGGPPRQGPAAPIARPHLDPDTVLAAATPLGRGSPTQVTWPTDREPAWQVGFAGHGPAVRVDDADGTARIKRDPGRRGRPLYRWLHDGEDTNLLWRLIITLAGVMPLLLGVTGYIMWLRSRTWRADVGRRRIKATA